VAGYQYGGIRLGAHTRVTRGGAAPDGGDAALSWENAPLPRGVTLREGIEHPDGGISIAREGAKGVKIGSATSTGRVVAATLAEAQLYGKHSSQCHSRLSRRCREHVECSQITRAGVLGGGEVHMWHNIFLYSG
jgi:hypothetical protein